MRIVSLACSNTEILAALGCAHLLVGVDDHSDHPPSDLEGLPRVGPDLEIDMEQVVALEPDLVLASLTVPGHETVVEGVEAAGLPHLTLAPTSLPDVYRNVETIARRLEEGGVAGVRDRARRLVEEMRRELGDLESSEESEGTGESPEQGELTPRGPSLLIQWWPKPVIAPCGQSWVDPLIHRAGGRNPLSSERRPSRPLEDEEVAAMAPDAIILSWCGVDPAKYRPDVVYRNPAFQHTPAIRNRNVFCVPEAYLGRPGPRLIEGIRALREVVRSVEAGGGVAALGSKG